MKWRGRGIRQLKKDLLDFVYLTPIIKWKELDSLKFNIERTRTMKEQKLTMRQILLIVIFSILGGLLFTLLFAWFTGDPFMKVLPIGFWFGPLMGIIITIMRFTSGKMVEETIDYDGNEDYPRRIKSILERLKYRLEGENENDYEWKYDGTDPDLLLSGNVTVQIKNTTVKITGPKIVVKKLIKFLNK